jgi:hypothetical protein
MKQLFGLIQIDEKNSIDSYADSALEMLNEGQKDELKRCEVNKLLKFNFTLGMTIRNRFNLWNSSNKLIRSLRGHCIHPEEAASMIIYRMWEKLNELN